MMKGGDDNTPGRQVYIISGDVRRNENQGIDIAKSTKDILVVDAETGKPEFIDISELESVADPVDAQQEIAAAEQEARQNTAQEIANKIDAVIEPVPEDVYEVADARSQGAGAADNQPRGTAHRGAAGRGARVQGKRGCRNR